MTEISRRAELAGFTLRAPFTISAEYVLSQTDFEGIEWTTFFDSLAELEEYLSERS